MASDLSLALGELRGGAVLFRPGREPFKEIRGLQKAIKFGFVAEVVHKSGMRAYGLTVAGLMLARVIEFPN